jgi:hypothetical protein
MQDLLVYAGLAVGGGGGVAAVAFWMKLGGSIKGAQLEAVVARAEAKSAAELARAMMERHDKTVEALADYRVKMATDIAVVKTLAEGNTTQIAAAELRIAKALESIGERFAEVREDFRTLHARIDAAIDKAGGDD